MTEHFDLIEDSRPWFRKAFAEYASEEDVRWALGTTTLPDPRLRKGQDGKQVEEDDGNPRWITAIVLYAEIPGVVEGTHLATTALIQPNMISESHAYTTTSEMVSRFAEMRELQADAMAQAQEEALRTGRPTPPGGPLS